MGTELGKNLVNGALSTGVGYGVTELTGNQELGMAAGVLSSFTFGKGLDDIDESLNISGLSHPKGLPKTTNHADDFDLSTPHAKSSVDVDIVRPKKINDTSDILENNYKYPVKDSFSGHSDNLLSKNNLGSISESAWDTKLIRDSNIPIKKNYPAFDVQNSNSHINDIGNNNTRFNRLATETVGYADSLTVSKTSSSTLSDIYTGGSRYIYSYDSPKPCFSSVDGVGNMGNNSTRVNVSVKQVEYGSTDLSRKAIIYRKENNITGAGNVAVYEYENNGKLNTIAGVSERGKGHAEHLIAKKLEDLDIKPCQVKRIYSDLEPCSIAGGYCKRFLKEVFPNADITYSFEYGITKESRIAGVKALKEAIKNSSNQGEKQ